MKAAIFYFTTGGNTEAMADILGTALTDNGVEVLKKAVSDASAEDFEGVDVFALGSPAQGNEEMDETEFMPFYNANKALLKDKKVFLFGSFGWVGGEYMETFAEEAGKDELNIIGIYTNLEAPEGDAEQALKDWAKKMI